MPNFNGTGPQGQGSRSGKGQGRCGRNQTEDRALIAETTTRRGFRMRFVAENPDMEQGINDHRQCGGRGKHYGRGVGRIHRGYYQ